MKRFWMLVALLLLLTGCSAEETLETVSDVYVQPVSGEVWQVIVDIPQDAGVTVLQSEEAGKLYLCDGYTATVQTMASGDLEKALYTLTGYEKDNLTLMQTQQGSLKRYECVWTAAGEGETQVGRACLLDDGNYLYTLTVMADETKAGALTEAWGEIFDSFRLASPDIDLNTGS